jgi:oligopeptide/dipeptide ABC transporter ATP-binding protein
MAAALLEVRGLGVTLGGARLVREVDLTCSAGRVHALVGESGSGKSTVARALLGLLPEGAVVTGTASFEGAELFGLPPAARAALRGRRLALVPQEALSSLDPVMSIGAQVQETLRVHQPALATEVQAVALLASVGLPEGPALLRAYPHQLSGGMKQRVLVGLALACGPALLIADEPTTALDAAVRRQVLALLRSLALERGLAVLIITHDLGSVESVADEVSVLYAGSVVEQGGVGLLEHPRHPYTQALLAARPGPGGFKPLRGVAASPAEVIEGCAFAPRCDRATGACRAAQPLRDGVACVHPLEGAS